MKAEGNSAVKPIVNLFHDQAYYYVSTIEPKINEDVTIRLRVEKGNVKRAYIAVCADPVVSENWEEYEMTLEKTDKTGYYEFFKATVPGKKSFFKYQFRCENDCPSNTVWYARTYMGPERQEYNQKNMDPDKCWCLVPGFKTPDWAKGVIWYSIMPDCFYNGDLTNDETISGCNFSNSWNRCHHNLEDKYGGDLRGIEKKLDYIRDLGAEAVFMDPIFRCSQNAGYGPEFYSQIENSFGNAQALIDLSKKVHDNGMHYMIDIVLAFVAIRDIWYNKGFSNPFPAAAQDWNSKYHDFFMFTGEEGDTGSYRSAWAGVELNHACEDLKQAIYKSKDSYLQYYCPEPFNVDAIRYDCGGSLYGIDKDGNRVPSREVVGEMRPVLRGMNPDMLLLSEYSFYNDIAKGVWDSRWNLEFARYTNDYIDGVRPESFYHWKYDNEMFAVPRTFALCQYNSMADHDRPRNHNKPKWAIRPQQMIHMTMVGSPAIYYGSEVDMFRGPATFYSMEWDESVWDYDTLFFIKSLIELRKKHQCVRDGAFKFVSVDDDNHIFSFARFDEKSTVITVASRNPYPTKISINVRELETVDGTVFTDWATGKKYTSVNGYINVDLLPGGSVFVTGDEKPSYMGGFAFENIGDAHTSVILNGPKDFTVSGNGKFNDFNDTVGFAYTENFNACSVSAEISKLRGSVALMLRAGLAPDDAFVAAGAEGKRLYTVVRKTKGGKAVKRYHGEFDNSTYLKIERNGKNEFTVSAAKTVGWLWNDLISGVHIDMPNHIKAGFTCIRGTADLENIAVKHDKMPVLFDAFDCGISAMFDTDEGYGVKYHKNALDISTDGKMSKLLTNSPEHDWTFKTSFRFSPDSKDAFAGVISAQDNDNYVVAGRKVIDGEPVFFIGRATGGKLLVYKTIKDTSPDHAAVVQLQRTGTAYSAVASYGGRNYKLIGKGVIAQLSAERVGLAVSGTADACFKFACFGDAINDGNSFNTPYIPGSLKIDLGNMQQADNYQGFRCISGDWDYAKEGFVHKSESEGQLAITNKFFKGFKVDATYSIEQGKGYVGFEFGEKEEGEKFGNGYIVAFSDDRTLSVNYKGKKLASVKIPEKYGKNQVKIAVDYRDGLLAAFAGQDGTPVLDLKLEGVEGYVSYVCKGVVAHINNYFAGSNDATMYRFLPFEYRRNGISNKWGHRCSFANPFGIALTDFALDMRLTVNAQPSAQNPLAGIYFGPEGVFTKDDSISITVDRNRKLAIKNGDEVLASAFISKEYEYNDIIVIKQGRDIKVYADGSGEPTVSYTQPILGGGTVMFYASFTNASFDKISLKNIKR